MKRYGFVLCAFLLCAPSVWALQNYYDAFATVYPFVSGTRLNSCAVCHNGPHPDLSSTDAVRNPYGLSFAAQTHGFNLNSQNQTAIKNIAGSDSDGDGVSNGVEIQHLTFPGNASDTPDVNPPSVSISAPGNGTSYNSPQTVTLQASASDSGGVSKVEFYEDGTLKGTVSSSPYNFNWTISAADNGSHTWTAKAYDNAQNSTLSSGVTLTVAIDVTAPTVSLTAPSSGTTYTSSQTVVLQAAANDNIAIANVEFYEDNVLKGAQNAPPYNFSWTISAADNGSHTWTAKAFDTSQNSSVSGGITLTVNIDNQNPTVSINSPSTGTTYSTAQSVLIQATASDNVAVARVDFLDNGNVRGTANSLPYNFNWTFTAADNGGHNWVARAYDAAGNSADATVSLTVNIDVVAPDVSITSPVDTTTYTSAQTVTIHANASDNVGVTQVQFYDNGALRATVTSPPYEYLWSFTGSDNGPHAWNARAFDNAGNTQNSVVNLTVNIDVTPPTVSLSAPVDGTTYTSAQTVNLEVAATDNVGVTQVQFYDNGALRSTVTSAPYVFGWTFGGGDNGPHQWIARAYDAAGNASSATINLSVNIDASPPTVSLSAPVDGTTYTSAQTVNLEVTATDNVGVTQVQFYDNGALRGTVTSAPYVFGWTFGGGDNGPHQWIARAYDAAGNASSATINLSVNIDVSPPTVSLSAPVDGTTYTSAQTVNLEVAATDNVGVTQVQFYDNGALRGTVTSAPYVFGWTFGGGDNGSHQWIARASDAAGNASSATINLSVNIDVTPPTVSLSAPVDGTTYNSAQTVNLEVTASDNVGVTQVQFYDNGALRGTVTSTPYVFGWTFGGADNGAHQWIARASDAAGNASSATINLSVNIDVSPPTVSLSAPVDGTTYTSAQTVNLEVAATDNVGVTQVQFYDNGALRGTVTSAPYVFGWTFGGSDNGPHQWMARAYDAAGNASSATINLTVNIDVTPPTVSLSSPVDGTIYTSAQTVNLQATASDNVGVTQVQFYDNGALRGTVTSAPYVFAWTFGGGDNGPHQWIARAYDAAGNASSATINLSVNIDIAPPAVSLSAPADGTIYTSAQTVNLQATATDNVAVTKVEFYDNGNLRGSVTSLPYQYAWTFTVTDNGPHTWIARAYDAAGNVASATINLTVNIDNFIQFAITSPANSTVYNSAQTVTIRATAADNIGISKVEFYDNDILSGVSTTPPYSYEWSISSADNGVHRWVARAYDATGHSRDAAVGLIVQIDVLAPEVTFTSPADGSSYTVPQTVNLQVTATDNVAVTRVEFYEDGLLLATVTSAPYSFAWGFAGLDNGNHTWTARAYDAAGNSATSGPVHLTVNISQANQDKTPPTIKLLSPADSTVFTSAQTVAIQVEAHDDVAVTRVEFYDNGDLRSTLTSPPFVFPWVFSAVENGAHTWLVRAFDGAGNNQSATALLTVDIDVTPPQIAITSLTDNTTYDSAQTIVITAQASDEKGVSRVEFYDNNVLLKTLTQPPYNFVWAFDDIDNGAHTWMARAYHAAGNSQTSASFHLTVQIGAATAPTLVMTQAGRNYMLSWFATDASYVLQQSRDLESWTNLPMAAPVADAINRVSLSVSVASLRIALQSTRQLSLNWNGDGQLQSAPSLAGPWSDIATSDRPHLIETTESKRFYRLKPVGQVFYRLHRP